MTDADNTPYLRLPYPEPLASGCALDRHSWSASKLWNVANYYARQQWDETGEVPGEKQLKHELKTHPKYKGLHSQSSQKVLEELSEVFSSWFGSDDDRDNPPGYRKRNYYDSTATKSMKNVRARP